MYKQVLESDMRFNERGEITFYQYNALCFLDGWIHMLFGNIINDTNHSKRIRITIEEVEVPK